MRGNTLVDITESLDDSMFLARLSRKETNEERRYTTSRSIKFSTLRLDEGGNIDVRIVESRRVMNGRSVVQEVIPSMPHSIHNQKTVK